MTFSRATPCLAADVAAVSGDLTYATMVTPAGLAPIARYADVPGPPIRALMPLRPDNRLGTPTAPVGDAHPRRPARAAVDVSARQLFPYRRNPRYRALGIDGFFTDDPALGRAALNDLTGEA